MSSMTKINLPVLTEEHFTLLEELSNACAVSGNEREVRRIVRREVKPYADLVETDALGNLYAVKKAKSENPLRVMIAAHMDEVGFMLVEEEDPGIFRFEIIGGIDPRALAGKSVLVGKDHKPGLIGACPVHLTTREERGKTIPLKELRIDTGPGTKDIKPGDVAYFATKFQRMGSSVCGKALDDRIGVFILIQLLKSVPENIELTAVFTVQEEVGTRGALVAAWDRAPHLAIAIDSTPAMDLPVWDGSESTVYRSKAGQGPVIYTADSGAINDPRLIRFLVQTGENYKIPYQLRQPGGGCTDASALQINQAGCPVVSVSTPGRYAHTAAGLARVRDWEAHWQLLHVALWNMDHDLLSIDR